MAHNHEPLLRVERLEVVYHHVSTAVQGISLQVRRNQIVTLLGTNGAGKTTVLRAVSGFLGVDNAKITDGFVEFDSRRINGNSPSATTKKGIVLVPEQDKVFDNMTVEENLHLCQGAGNPAGGGFTSLNEVYDLFGALKKLRNRQAGYLSGGERQMLTLSAALLCRPRLLLVDELSLGLAPQVVKELMLVLKEIRDNRNVSILLVEQNAMAALEIADYGYVMENGRMVFSGDPDRLRGHEDIREFYLGAADTEDHKSYRDVKQYRRTRRWYG